ncbi:MAG: hypothetical protein J0L79_00920 [Rickettsiales bacterium]|nr:hypothetical protein [Rickettsiales bacterium]
MSKDKSFWEWLFGNSCCAGRDKDKDYTREREEGKDRIGDKDKSKDKNLTTSKRLESDFDEQPGSIFSDVDLNEDSVYHTGITGESDDGSVEIR